MADTNGRYTPSPPPPPPPPKERPPVQTQPPVHNAAAQPDLTSPVKRKPLPTNATTSPPRARQPSNNSTQIFGQVVQHLTAQRQASQSPPRTITKDVGYTFYNTDSPATNEGDPRISREDFPKPLVLPDVVEDTVTEEDMALKPDARPPPLRMDSTSSQQATDSRKPQTPGSKFTSFFTRKQTSSPGAEEAEGAKSPLPSPWPNSAHSANSSTNGYPFPSRAPASQPSQDSIEFDPHTMQYGGLVDRAAILEAELREISKELAGSIKREMDLEDMVERFQVENPNSGIPADRTSDYFSDSGTSSIRPPTSEYSPKEEIERMKRELEQQKAQLKVDFSQKWQREVATRKAMENHLQYMEQRLRGQHLQRDESIDMSSKTKELESSLDDAKRRLNEERQTNQNFEDLLSALREDLSQVRNERDNLREEIVPSLKSRIEGLEAATADAQKAPYDVARMQHELQSLRDENAALHSARMMNAQFESIAEEDGTDTRRNSLVGAKGLQRSTTLGRSTSRAGAGMSRSNSVSKNVQNESRDSLADQLKATEQQREALHNTVKYLLRRQTHQNKQHEKKLQVAEFERDRATQIALTGGRKQGYEKEVRVLRSEINLLRKRADDAMEQKWQCEKGLASLAMDLSRSKQETESLHRLLEVKDKNDPEDISTALETALSQLNQQRSRVMASDSLGSIENEQAMADELERSAERAEALAAQVKQQVKTNSALRSRLKDAITQGEQSQVTSGERITELQAKLRKLEDTITAAQTQSETAVMKHEEEMRVMRASTNFQLLRAKNSNPNLLSPTPRSPLSPMIANSKRSPRLEQTSSGPGMPLHEALRTEYLEKKVAELEKALAEAENEMGEVVGRMNTAQISTMELEGERYVISRLGEGPTNKQ